MSATRDEHVRLFVTCLNIAAGGLAVSVAVTLPLAALTSGHISLSDQVSLELIYAATAVVLHGLAQFTLKRFG